MDILIGPQSCPPLRRKTSLSFPEGSHDYLSLEKEAGQQDGCPSHEASRGPGPVPC